MGEIIIAYPKPEVAKRIIGIVIEGNLGGLALGLDKAVGEWLPFDQIAVIETFDSPIRAVLKVDESRKAGLTVGNHCYQLLQFLADDERFKLLQGRRTDG